MSTIYVVTIAVVAASVRTVESSQLQVLHQVSYAWTSTVTYASALDRRLRKILWQSWIFQSQPGGTELVGSFQEAAQRNCGTIGWGFGRGALEPSKSTVGMGNCVSSSSEKLKQSENEGTCKYCKGFTGETGPAFAIQCTCFLPGTCSCPPNAAPLPSCVFYSPRIQGLLEGLRTEYETSQDHWTMVDPTTEAEAETIGEENRKYFDEVLVQHPEWGAFFSRYEDVEISNEKIGEGGQAEIFKASSQRYNRDDTGRQLVAKVWKAGVSLKDLERQWPPQMLSRGVLNEDDDWPFKNIKGATFIRDGEFRNRFAFVMVRRWMDLRSHVDESKLYVLRHCSWHGPHLLQMQDVYHYIAESCKDLVRMHATGVIHRDIKASNVLIDTMGISNRRSPYVIDFECSLGVAGTGFWRAPEILEQLQKKVPGHEVLFTKKADIYSFGMMCYEMVTGCIPFEGHPQNEYSIVLRGERPELPGDLAPWLTELVHDCWQQDPELRPTSMEIFKRLQRLKRVFFPSNDPWANW